jgi:hypothetical protein
MQMANVPGRFREASPGADPVNPKQICLGKMPIPSLAQEVKRVGDHWKSQLSLPGIARKAPALMAGMDSTGTSFSAWRPF